MFLHKNTEMMYLSSPFDLEVSQDQDEIEQVASQQSLLEGQQSQIDTEPQGSQAQQYALMDIQTPLPS